MTENKIKNIHQGHRKRLMDQYERNGADSLNEHQLLELALFSSIPRGDTNPTAHRLIDDHGSLYGVIKASKRSLSDTAGIGRKSADMISACTDLTLRALADKCISSKKMTDSRIMTYLTLIMMKEKDDTSAAIFISPKGKHLATKKYPPVLSDDISRFADELADEAHELGAKSVVLAHSHGDSGTAPSPADMATTLAMKSHLWKAGIRLTAHYIVSDMDCADILPACLGK